MAVSYRDITGPVTALITFSVKTEFADEVSQYMMNNVAELMRDKESGKVPGFLSLEYVRFGDTFATWERYTDPDAVERVITVRYLTFMKHPLAETFTGPPTMLFFPTDSLSRPST